MTAGLAQFIQHAQVNHSYIRSNDGRLFTVIQKQIISPSIQWVVVQYDDDETFEKISVNHGKVYRQKYNPFI